MAERKIPVSVLSLLEQPVMIVKKELISYMNPAAVSLAGKDFTGKPASLLLPSHLTGTHGGTFTSTGFIGKRNCVVNVCSI